MRLSMRTHADVQWEQAIGDLIRTSMTFPGHQGSIVLKPESADRPHYRIITRFDTTENMQRRFDDMDHPSRLNLVFSGLAVSQDATAKLVMVNAWSSRPRGRYIESLKIDKLWPSRNRLACVLSVR